MAARKKLLIVGSGLSGLFVAYKLLKANVDADISIYEASNKIGGRIQTLEGLDLGATWHWREMEMVNLLKDLQLERVRDDAVNGFRVLGGMQQLIDGIYRIVQKRGVVVHLNSPVLSFTENTDNDATIQLENGDQIKANFVFFAMPPRQALRIIFNPPLDKQLALKMSQTPTWMAQQGKFGLIFTKASSLADQKVPKLLKDQNSPLKMGVQGPVFNLSHPSNPNRVVLFSFKSVMPFEGGFSALTTSEYHRKEFEANVAHLTEDLKDWTCRFVEQDWSLEKHICTDADKNEKDPNRHPAYHLLNWKPNDGKYKTCAWAGSECASRHAGYAEGALVSANDAVLYFLK